jgi:pilus assembly protein Flp/PilA
MNSFIFGIMASLNSFGSQLSNRMRKFHSKDEGVTAVEYALIIGLVAIVIIGAVTLLGGSISTVFSRAACVVKGGTWNTTTSVCS